MALVYLVVYSSTRKTHLFPVKGTPHARCARTRLPALSRYLFGSLLVSSLGTLEEILPFTDILPTATLAWASRRVTGRVGTVFGFLWCVMPRDVRTEQLLAKWVFRIEPLKVKKKKQGSRKEPSFILWAGAGKGREGDPHARAHTHTHTNRGSR